MATDIIARGMAINAETNAKAYTESYALPLTTKYGAAINATIDGATYVVTIQLKDQNGDALGEAQTLDLPLESVVVGGRYDSQTKNLVLMLDNGNEIEIPVADLIEGLQNEITPENPLDADLVDDETSAHKFVTAAEKEFVDDLIENYEEITLSAERDSSVGAQQLENIKSGTDSYNIFPEFPQNGSVLLKATVNNGSVTMSWAEAPSVSGHVLDMGSLVS